MPRRSAESLALLTERSGTGTSFATRKGKPRRLVHEESDALGNGCAGSSRAAGVGRWSETTRPHKAAKRVSGKATSDRAFVMNAAKGGMAEVELGKLAAEKGTRDEVKKFGQRMVDDHGKAGADLKTLAQNKNITLPADIGPKEKALRDRLSKLSGDAFDRAYMQGDARGSPHGRTRVPHGIEGRQGRRYQGMGVEDAADARRAPPARARHQPSRWDFRSEVRKTGNLSSSCSPALRR